MTDNAIMKVLKTVADKSYNEHIAYSSTEHFILDTIKQHPDLRQLTITYTASRHKD